jgi:hypothetical protein
MSFVPDVTGSLPDAPKRSQALREQVERCRRLARATTDQAVSRRLLELAEKTARHWGVDYLRCIFHRIAPEAALPASANSPHPDRARLRGFGVRECSFVSSN